EFRIDDGVIDDVIAVARALARLREGRRIEMGDAECLQVGYGGRGGIEIEIRGELQAVGGDRDDGMHQLVSTRQNTDQGVMTSRGVPPQIVMPPVSPGWRVISRFDRLAVSSSLAPSPSPQPAVTMPLSPACASPKAAFASRGTISCRRTARSSCTSASRWRCADWLRDCQSSTAD